MSPRAARTTAPAIEGAVTREAACHVEEQVPHIDPVDLIPAGSARVGTLAEDATSRRVRHRRVPTALNAYLSFHSFIANRSASAAEFTKPGSSRRSYLLHMVRGAYIASARWLQYQVRESK